VNLLEGVRVLETGSRIAAAFCAGTLGEQGAEVIKVEPPGSGEYLRVLGPLTDGYSMMWAVEGRNRKSVTLDLRDRRGQALFRRLAENVDVVCENFRPGTMERWGLGPADLPARLVYVRLSVFGQTGPAAARPGVDLLGLAYGGLLGLTGDPDRPPVKSNVTVSDHLAGVFGAKAAVAALYRRDVTGSGIGAVIDASLQGSILRTLDWMLAATDQAGIEHHRSGNRDVTVALSNVLPTRDRRELALVASSARQIEALGDLIGSPPTPETVAAWVAARDAFALEESLLGVGVPAAVVRTAAEVLADPLAALVPVDDPHLGCVRQQAPFPKVADTPSPRGAPELGQHNDEIWCGLVGLSAPELDDLRRDGVV